MPIGTGSSVVKGLENRDWRGGPVDVPSIRLPFGVESLTNAMWRKEPVDWMLPVFWSLARWYEPCVVGEIGFQHGISSLAWLIAARDYGGHVYSMDTNPCKDGIDAIHDLDLSEWHTFIHGNSRKKRFPEMLDILFIDGDHDVLEIEKDRDQHIEMVRNGGLILYHDTNWPNVSEYLASIGVLTVPLGAGLGIECVSRRERSSAMIETSREATPFTAINYSGREKFRPAYEQVAKSLVEVLDPKSVIDVGSGQGFLIDALLPYGVDVRGIEVSDESRLFMSDEAKARTVIRNVLWDTPGRYYDLVCCIEVAEHIEPQYSQVLVRKLCELTSKAIYFTAASPFQPGVGHINCHPTTDWLYLFHKEGWNLDIEETIKIRARLGALSDAPWISMNSMLFVKENNNGTSEP